MMHYLSSAMLVVASIIHLLPLSGFLGSARLLALYGFPIEEPNITILMRHRSVLFGLLGAFLLYAAFNTSYQTMAYIGGIVSVVTYLWLCLSIGGYNDKLKRIFYADLIALVCLIIGAVTCFFE